MIPHDRRSARRIETGHLVIHSELPSQGQCLGMAVTLDLNEFGLRVQTNQKFSVGERFRFSIALKEEIVSATGRIVHSEAALNGTWEVGIEFLQIAAEDIERIREFSKARS
ncbi:MAG: PilZ domain-containing protein [Planctomycetes bacterium]|nr:PilZ domain-containing protein [Planctomycetota bacterium]